MPDRYSALERAAVQTPSPGPGGHAAQSAASAPAGRGQPMGRIRVAQAQLQTHGFSTGHSPNGQLTPGTSQAIQAFQSKRGLSPTGTLDERTAAALARPPSPAGRTVGSRRAKGGPILVHSGSQGNRASGTAQHSRAGGGQGTAHASSRGSSSSSSQPNQQGASQMQRGSNWESAGKRVPLIFASNGTVAAGSSVTIPVQPQVAFRGENFVVDATTAANFSVVSFKVGVPDQNAGGSGNIPCSIYAPNQNGAIDYEMDLADSGTIIQLTVINTDTAAHAFVGTLWGHEITQQ